MSTVNVFLLSLTLAVVFCIPAKIPRFIVMPTKPPATLTHTTLIKPATTPPPPRGCLSSGQFYPGGAVVGKDYPHCSLKSCSCSGHRRSCNWIYHDSWECLFGRTTQITTLIPTTLPPTVPRACQDNGRFYPPGGVIGKSYPTCSEKMCQCSENSCQWLYIDSWDCIHGRTTRRTTIPTGLPTTTGPSPTCDCSTAGHTRGTEPCESKCICFSRCKGCAWIRDLRCNGIVG